MRLPNYVNQFKELIKKAGISGEVALHMFGNGLTTDEFEKAMLTQPTSLTGWYDAAIRLDNIRTRTSTNSPRSGNSQSSHQHDEWAMQVDHLSINDELVIRSMSPEKREHYIKEGLCFICRQKGHMSGECPKKKKHSSYKGKGQFKGGKKGRSGHGRYIRATSDDGNDNDGSDEDVQESKPDYTKNIRALTKTMSRDEKTSLMLSLAEETEDF